MSTKVYLSIITIFLVIQARGSVAELSTYKRFNTKGIDLLLVILNKDTNAAFSEADLVSYHKKRKRFDEKKKLEFSQKDVVIDAFVNIDKVLFDKFFVEGKDLEIQIRINRSAPQILKLIAVNPDVNEAVRSAALISIQGTEHVPAIIADEFVDHVAPLSSAYSKLQAERGMVYEAFRKEKYNDLIIAHEGFHSAMRLLISMNRMNKLSQYMVAPLANGLEYDMYLSEDIDALESLSAPGLETVSIDERFTSDHHGVIMASIHHGINQAISTGLVSYVGENVFDTDYPFHYISKEKGWDPLFTLKMVEELSFIQEEFISDNQKIKDKLVSVSKKLNLFFN